MNKVNGLKLTPVPVTQIRFQSVDLKTSFEVGKKLLEQQKQDEENKKKSKKVSKIVAVFIGGAIAYFTLSLYLDYHDDKPDTSEKALQYKPGIIKKFSKNVNIN